MCLAWCLYVLLTAAATWNVHYSLVVVAAAVAGAGTAPTAVVALGPVPIFHPAAGSVCMSYLALLLLLALH